MGSLTIASSVTNLFLPETFQKVLPETLEQMQRCRRYVSHHSHINTHVSHLSLLIKYELFVISFMRRDKHSLEDGRGTVVMNQHKQTKEWEWLRRSYSRPRLHEGTQWLHIIYVIKIFIFTLYEFILYCINTVFVFSLSGLSTGIFNFVFKKKTITVVLIMKSHQDRAQKR